MNAKRFATLSLFLCIMFLPFVSEVSTVHSKDGFNIVNLVKGADIIVVGTVQKTEFVFRDSVRPRYTTDITVEVQDQIKGEFNVGENVVFMIFGGSGINPETGEDITLEVQKYVTSRPHRLAYEAEAYAKQARIRVQLDTRSRDRRFFVSRYAKTLSSRTYLLFFSYEKVYQAINREYDRLEVNHGRICGK